MRGVAAALLLVVPLVTGVGSTLAFTNTNLRRRGALVRVWPLHSDGKAANRTGFTDEVTRPFRDARRFPLDGGVARAGGYTHAAQLWDLSIVQGPFSAPCQPQRYDSQLSHRHPQCCGLIQVSPASS